MTPALHPCDVHVWPIALDRPSGEFRLLLSADEIERAAKFRVPHGEDRYIVGRGVLRTILSRYTGIAPREIVFAYGEFGKPEIPAREVRFNLSHSHGFALVAVTHGSEVGVDIEMIREKVTREQIAERFFSPAEARAMAALPPEQQVRGFFNCWTRKEAWMKARGGGMSIPLDSFDVSLAPGEPARLLATRPDPDEAARWSLVSLDQFSGYAAAVAVRQPRDGARDVHLIREFESA